MKKGLLTLSIVAAAVLTGVAWGQRPERDAPAASAKQAFDPAELRRFTEAAMYLGRHETGLYPGGKNEIPEAHRKAGQQIAAKIRPLGAEGVADEKEGRILGLVLGHSNCSMYFSALQKQLQIQRRLLHPRFELVNAAVGGQQLPQIVTLQGGVWERARSLLENRPGYSRQQVQVLFLHTTYHGAGNPRRDPPRPFPENMRQMERDLEKVLAYCVERFPNLRIAYLTCDGFRHYTGFEPHVYQEAFALKWLVERQIKGEPATRYEGPDRRLPWLTWGPYIWDNAWDKSYFTDGVHPAQKALEIFVDKYWQHLCRDTVAQPWLFAAVPPTTSAVPASRVREVLGKLPSPRGICAILGDPRGELAIELAKASQLQAYVQLASDKDVEAARRAADAAGMLNTRVYVEKGTDARIHFADNLADAVIVCVAAGDRAVKAEVLRILRPGGTAWLGTETLVKPEPKGIDQWSHPYHGPDNNPQSTDQLARAPYLTQFLAEPWYCPMPEMTVAAGGRIFKVFGSRAFLRPQWPVLNTLIAMNGYNGTILWQRPLDPNFMIHRNTMIATADTLYLGDATSCKLFDAATGQPKGAIRVPEAVSDGPAWKWMALEDGVLYALVGEKEPPGDNLQGQGFRGAGWPWWKIDRYGWGFGRTLLAIDVATRKVLWHHREPEPLDTRAVCMKAGRIYFYSHPKYLGCVDAKTGELVWKSDDRAVLEAIGEHHPAQFPATGFATSAYMKCGENALYFAGPQRTRLVAVSTADGKLLWQYPKGAFQLVLRDDGLYAMGAMDESQKFDPKTGQIVRQLFRRAGCTRATGSVDRIFVRGGGDGTFSWNTAAEKILPIAPMRPACHDGVVIAGGHLYWGPWMCGCNLSLIGIVCLAPAGDFNFSMNAVEAERLERAADDPAKVAGTEQTADDWPTYRKDNARSTRSERPIAEKAAVKWEFKPRTMNTCTAPVTVGDLVFVGGSDGAVRALEARSGKPKWTAYTGGAIRVPPSIAEGRALVGSADGWIYAFEAVNGRLLWRFRAAPVERKIPVYGSLASTWPVAGGVLVDSGVAYAAAGIANYDGTHVYALDAATGRIRWQNNTSGITEGGQGSGASVQGDLLLSGGKLYLAGGNRVPLASYDAASGAFQPVRPVALPYARDPRGPRGPSLFLRGDGRIAVSGTFPLYTRPEDVHYIDQAELPCPPATLAVTTGGLGLVLPAPGEGGKEKAIWAVRPFQENVAVALAKNAVLVAGTDRRAGKREASPEETYGLAALENKTGKVLWRHSLPAGPVRWGVAVDRSGRVVVSLRDGRVLCFAGND